MFSRLRAPKPWGIALILSLIIVLMVAIFGLRIAQNKAEKLIFEKVTARGWGLELNDFKVSFTGKVRAARICVSLADDEHNDLCFEKLTLHLQPSALLRRRIKIGRLDADVARLDSTRERLSRLRAEVSDDISPAEASTPTRVPTLRHGRIENVNVRLQGLRSIAAEGDDAQDNLPQSIVELQLQDAVLENTSDDASIHARGSLLAFKGGERVLDQSLGALIGEPFSIEIRGSLDDGVQHANLAFEQPIDAQLHLRDRIDVGFESVSFDAPYAVRVNAPTLRIDERSLFLTADWVETHVGVWTTDLPQFYLTSLTANAPHLELPHDQTHIVIRRVNEMIGARREQRFKTTEGEGNRGQDRTDDDSTTTDNGAARGSSTADSRDHDADGDGVHTQDDPRPAHAPQTSAIPTLIRMLTEQRNWWEILPRAIEFQDGRIQLTGDSDTDLVQIQDVHLRYGVRVLHQQMDLEFGGNITREDDDSGKIDVRLEWDYSRKIGRAFWEIEDFSLDSLGLIMGILPVDQLSGVFESEGRLRIDRKQRITGAHRTTLRDLHLTHSRLSDTLSLRHFSVAGDIGHGEPVKGESPSLIFKQQAVALEDSRATVEVELKDFQVFGRPRTSSAHIDLSVPDQPAMQLFESIPLSIRGPLKDVEMAGSWGLRLVFTVEHVGMTDDGKSLWTITAPSVYELRDRGLTLISLPKEVDVRRLNGKMRFVFRGPADGFMRSIDIPSPDAVKEVQRQIDQNKSGKNARTSNNDATKNNATPKTPTHSKTHAWTPLREMSYYFIATQLYREDGSFFRNSGINWLQIRRVLSDALTHRRVQRGASTITMQTVKNVFLTHEQSAERKIQELFLSYWMTRAVPKERILEVYLNILELCPHCNGADEGSQFHFETPIGELGIRESIWLSAISPNPTALGGKQPKKQVPYAGCARCDQILRALHARDWINDGEYAAAMHDPSAPRAHALDAADHVADSDDTDGLSLEHEASGLDAPGGWFSGHLLDVPQASDAASLDTPTRDVPSPDTSSLEIPVVEAPLLEKLDADDSSAADFEHLSVDERLDAWIGTSRPVRGTR